MKFLVLGAAEMGYAITFDLIRSPKVKSVVVADKNVEKVKHLKERLQDEKIVPVELDVTNQEYVAELMSKEDVTISCLPDKFNYDLAKLALQTKSNFCDLGNNIEVSEKIFLLNEVATDLGVAIVPNLGLSPGLVSILAVCAAQKMDELYEIKIRVGRLPQEPQELSTRDLLPEFSSALAVEELIKGYTDPTKIIRSGKLLKVPALEDVEHIKFPNPIGEVEAFTTSFGNATSGLFNKYLEKVQHLDYKTIRYKGHLERIKLLFELGLFSEEKIKLDNNTEVSPKALITHQLTKLAPEDVADVVLMRITVTGVVDKEPIQNVWECIDFADQADQISALARMTATPASIIAQMVARGDIEARGVLRQEDVVPHKLFLAEIAARNINLSLAERAPVHDTLS